MVSLFFCTACPATPQQPVVPAAAEILAAAGPLARRYGLVPPDNGGLWGPGEP